VFEAKVLRRIFGPKRQKITRVWRKMLHNFYYSPTIRMIKSRRMGGTCSTKEGDEKFVQCFWSENQTGRDYLET
jgi:hypothetical protein